MTGPYDDIIHLPHPTSARHPRMSPMDRAAQFSPFAALTGYEAVIRETGRLTGFRAELDEDAKIELDRKLRLIASNLAERPLVRITFFQEDKLKAGGSYQIADGFIQKIDDQQRVVVMSDGARIPIDDIDSLMENANCTGLSIHPCSNSSDSGGIG